MTRPALGTATINALESQTAHPIYFVELQIDMASSPQVVERLHSSLGTITWNSVDWYGGGPLMSLDSVQESVGGPAPFKASLSGIDASLTNLVFGVNYYRRPCLVYLGALSGGALVEDPGLIFSGFIEKLDMVFGDSDNGDSITLTAESEMILFKRSRNIRYTDRQLQSEYSGDLGLEYLEEVATTPIQWRGRNNNLGGAAGNGVGTDPNEFTDFETLFF